MNPLSTCVRSLNHVLCALSPCLPNARRQGVTLACSHMWLAAGSVEPNPQLHAACKRLWLPEVSPGYSPLCCLQQSPCCLLSVCEEAAHAHLQ